MVKSRGCSFGWKAHLPHIHLCNQRNFYKMPGSPGGCRLPNPYSSSKDSVTENNCLAISVFFTTWKEKKKKQYNYGFFKGQCEVLWWDARWVHCTFPQQNSGHFSAAIMKSPFWQKANITQIHSGLASRALWWLSIPFSTLVLLQPIRGGLLSLSGRGGDVLSVCFNALQNAVRFATFCQINSGFVLSSLRGPIDDHFRCPSQSRCAVSIHISFMEFLAVQLHRLSEMLSLGPESSSGWMRQAESMHLDWITFPCSAHNGLIGGFREFLNCACCTQSSKV